jgi:hypothetical protein
MAVPIVYALTYATPPCRACRTTLQNNILAAGGVRKEKLVYGVGAFQAKRKAWRMRKAELHY